MVSGSDHAGKTDCIGIDSCQFNVRIQSPVLIADTGTEQEQVHASQFIN